MPSSKSIEAPRESVRVILREIPGLHFGVAGMTKEKANEPAKTDEYSNVDTTFAAVNSGIEKVGFVALSQICSGGTYPHPTTSSAPVYPPTIQAKRLASDLQLQSDRSA